MDIARISDSNIICNIRRMFKFYEEYLTIEIGITQKVFQCHLLKWVLCIQSFTWFHAIEFERKVS